MSIVQTVMEAVVKLTPDAPPDPLIDSRSEVGRPIARIDGPLKVAGAARFAAEVRLDRLAYATLVCSTIAKGRIEHIDADAARSAPGVIEIVTHENAPKMKAPPQMFSDRSSASASNLPVMQDDAVRWNGQPVAVILAETQEKADHAASLLRVRYATEPADVSFEAMRPKAKPPKNILGEPTKIEIGDAEAALREAVVRVDETYTTPRYNHNAIELHAVTVEWSEDEHGDDRLTVHDATQSLAGTRYTLAKVFGLKEERIRVLSPFVGGGFGNKAVWSHTILAIAAARLVKRPVRLVITREQVFRLVGGRTFSEQRVALGARAGGALSALIHTGLTGVTSHNAFPEQFTFPARHLYAAENLLVAQEIVELDMVANTSMRAPGESIGTFALESALDELAIKLRLDPIELRRRIEPEKDPTKDSAFSSRHLLEAFRRGAERFGWSRRPPEPRSQRDGEWWIGQGVATATYPYYRMPGGAARIRIDADGSALVQTAAHEMGMGTATVQTQCAADRLGLPLAKVRFEYGDSLMPDSPVAGGSSQSASIIAAVAAAAEALTKALIEAAGEDSPLAGAKPDDVEMRDGGLFLREGSLQGETYGAILRRAGRDHVEAKADAPKPIEMMKFSMHSFGAQFCEVRVSEVTGEVRVSRWLGSFDTGRILNPRTAASQFRGGIVMGIGLALTEESFFDERSGRFVNPSLAEYHVPVHLDVPEIDVIWNDIPDPHSPMGVHGIGEIGITGCGAAIANAVWHATGKRIRALPLTLDKVLSAIPG